MEATIDPPNRLRPDTNHGWAIVNLWNRPAGITQVPEPGRLGGVVPVAPRGRIGMLNNYVLPDQSFVACPDEYDGQLKIKDWNDVPSFPAPEVGGERSWVVPELFFDQLPAVLDAIDPLPGEESLYVMIGQVLDAAATDPEVKATLTELAVETETEVIGPLFRWKHDGIPAANGWNRSSNNAPWGFDYLMRTAGARSNMFDNRPSETQYFSTDHDSAGAQLDGSNQYAITFPSGLLPPVHGFWSLTLYNDHHLFELNDLGRYSLRTKNTNLHHNPDGSLTLYAGAAPPATAPEQNWLPAPTGEFSLYIRCYWATDAVFDGTWTPPTVEQTHAFE